MSRQADYVTIARQHVRDLWNALNAIEEMQKEWNALDYGTTLATAKEGDNTGITAAQVGACVFDSANALRTVLNAGTATNLARLL